MPAERYAVKKMVFGKTNGKVDKSIIIYNSFVTVADIPLEAYQYVVNGKSAIEWIMERYQVTTDQASGIVNDPNAWSEDPSYIFDLLRRIVRVSIDTMKIVDGLPELKESEGTHGSLSLRPAIPIQQPLGEQPELSLDPA